MAAETNLLPASCSHQLFRSFSLRVVSDSSCLLISFATPGSHDQGMWKPSTVTRLPVPMLTGKKLMGVFSLLVLQRSAFIRMKTGYLDAPQNLQEGRNKINCLRKKPLKSLCLRCCSSYLCMHSIPADNKLKTVLLYYTWLDYDVLNCYNCWFTQ